MKAKFREALDRKRQRPRRGPGQGRPRVGQGQRRPRTRRQPPQLPPQERLIFPARCRALGTPALSLVARSLRSLPPQSEDRGAPFGSRVDPLAAGRKRRARRDGRARYHLVVGISLSSGFVVAIDGPSGVRQVKRGQGRGPLARPPLPRHRRDVPGADLVADVRRGRHRRRAAGRRPGDGAGDRGLHRPGQPVDPRQRPATFPARSAPRRSPPRSALSPGSRRCAIT